MNGILITVFCILATALSVPAAIAVMSAHGHAIKGIGLLLVPVAPLVVIALAIVADLGWWLVLIAAVPTIIMVVGSLFRDSDGRNLLEDMNITRPKRRK